MKINSDLTTIKLTHGSPEWHAFRKTGIGGSEIGVLIPNNEHAYKCAAQLFYEKLGIMDPTFPDNKYTYWGKKLESLVAEAWQMWDWKTNDFLQEVSTGNVLRKCYKVNSIVINPDYPQLFASIDRRIQNGSTDYMGHLLPNGGILEVKTMSGYVKKQWEVPPDTYLYQVHQYMMVYRMEYAEIATLVDGRDFYCYPVELNQDICDDIQNLSYNFMHKHVNPARVLVADYLHAQETGRVEEAERVMAEIQRYEPDPENTDAYKSFINQKYEKKYDQTYAPDEYLFEAMLHLTYKMIEKLAKSNTQGIENKLREAHEKAKVEKFVLRNEGEECGYTRMYTKSNQTNPTFDNKCNIKPKVKAIEDMFNQLKEAIYDNAAEGGLFGY